MTQKLNVEMVSLGCDKNRVDSEVMLGALSGDKYNLVYNENMADIIIVNTCGFIESAKQESIDTILELAALKEKGRLKALIVSGCLAERYSDDLLEEIPEIDAIVGVGNYMDIESIIKKVLDGYKKISFKDNINYDININAKRVLTTPIFTAYVKISEGCNNSCTYCIIPKIRGKYRSRSIENILSEVEELAQNGTKEIILVAQDTTKYGIDIYGKKNLPQLVDSISKIEGIEWIRLLYCYPEDIDDELIYEIKNNEKVCNYIDMPIQHVNNNLLITMKRRSRKEEIIELINKLRKNIPDIVIRTSIIVGFPGETEEQFNELYDFINEFKLDRVGIFTYSQEEGTEAALIREQIDEKIKRERQRKLLALQNKISYNKNKEKIGRVFKVLIEAQKDENIFMGRTYGDSPDIDNAVFIKQNNYSLKIGEFIDARIIRTSDYDMVGVVENESGK